MDIKDLSLREKIGQTVISLCVEEEHIQKCGSIENFIKKYPIGGLYPCGNLVNGLMKSVEKKEFDALMAKYNKYSRIPLIAACDGTNDSKGTITFGSLMALGAANDEQLAYDYGKAIGSKINECGMHWIFSPVVDLNMSDQSPITNARSLSDDPDRAIPLAKQIIKGIQDQGIAAGAKHYPGTDDKESIDPHLAPVNNTISKEKWDATNGRMYEAVIKDGVYSIMVGHQNLVAYQTNKIDGRYPPATMSKDLIDGLLKDKLGFRGVAVTDALVMGGFTGANGLQNQVESLNAGNDMLLWPSVEYIDEAEKKILSGEVSIQRLDDAVSRVLELKRKLGILDGMVKRVEYDFEWANEVSRKISEKGITLIRNTKDIIPNRNIKKVLVVGVTPDDQCYEDLCCLKDSFAQYGIDADVQRDIWQGELYDKQAKYDLFVFALCRMTHRPIGPLDFWGVNASSIWASNSADTSKTVVVSFGNPYAFKYYKETDMTYINAYSPAKTMLDAFVKGVIGEIPFVGTSPVQL